MVLPRRINVPLVIVPPAKSKSTPLATLMLAPLRLMLPLTVKVQLALKLARSRDVHSPPPEAAKIAGKKSKTSVLELL